MKGDFSRDTFDPRRHYGAVRLQQGRVVTDADWNEQADITRHRAERLARDTIGPSGAPLEGAGYALTAGTEALAVLALDAARAWVAAEDGALLATADGGAGWALLKAGSAAHLRALARAGGTAWAVGDGGTVLRSGDDGVSWQPRDAGTHAALRAVAAVDAQHVWVAGDGGAVLRSGDGGTSWEPASTGVARLTALAFADASSGLAVGTGGAVLRSADGGVTWESMPGGTAAHLRALARVGPSLAWAAGQGGVILRSTDAGATWQACATPADATATLHALWFRDAGEGWAAGEGGTLLRSADGGASWQRIGVAGVAAALRGLGGAGTAAPWVVGAGATVLRPGQGSPPTTQVLALPAVNLAIGPGRMWVQGIACELEARTSYVHQGDGGAGERLAPGTYLMVLRAWQRHVSALEQPALREVALGGPDTATRAQTVAQVRALALPAATGGAAWSCGSAVPAWDALVNAPRPRLAVRAEPQPAAANLCEIAATAGYRRLENQLYRVEVHRGGTEPGFKWSRENGSVAYAVLGLSVDVAANRTVARVAARGQDANLDLSVGDCVELVDDDAELTQRAGQMLRYVADGDDELELVLEGMPAGALGRDPARHPLLRRWEHRPAAGADTLPLREGEWQELEDGVQVRFEPGGPWRPGDHWLIPARTVTGDVEWPRDDDGDPVAREPAGIADAWCRLGLVQVDGAGVVSVLADCRELFPPLTAQETLLYVCGDGQAAAPGALLAQPLAVRVAHGSEALAGARVRFEVEAGGGSVRALAGGTGAARLDDETDADGLAECHWTLGPDVGPQRLRAVLLDAAGQPLPAQRVVFGATAALQLLYVSGDGQQAAPGANVPVPLEVRVVHGNDAVAGVPLRAMVELGGGAVLGSATFGTGPDGSAAIGWQLGTAGAQRLRVELLARDGRVLQARSFHAALALPAAGGGGGCDVTIGVGGQFERLDSALLQRLLKQGGGSACLCFMPGTHEVPDLKAEGARETGRLSLHGCGPTALLRLRSSAALGGFAALELRDLALVFEAPNAGVALQNIGEACLRGVTIEQRADPGSAALDIGTVQLLRMQDCRIQAVAAAPAVGTVALLNAGVLLRGVQEALLDTVHIEQRSQTAAPALLVDGGAATQRVAMQLRVSGCDIRAVSPTLTALVLQNLSGDCRVLNSRFVGSVSLYGLPGADRSIELSRALPNLPRQPLGLGTGQLVFKGNHLVQLTASAAVVEQLFAGGTAPGLLRNAVLQGNTFDGLGSIVPCGFLNLAGNVFMAQGVPGAATPYAVLLSERATAVGNLSAVAPTTAPPFLHFRTGFAGGFAGAANQVSVTSQP